MLDFKIYMNDTKTKNLLGKVSCSYCDMKVYRPIKLHLGRLPQQFQMSPCSETNWWNSTIVGNVGNVGKAKSVRPFDCKFYEDGLSAVNVTINSSGNTRFFLLKTIPGGGKLMGIRGNMSGYDSRCKTSLSIACILAQPLSSTSSNCFILTAFTPLPSSPSPSATLVLILPL